MYREKWYMNRDTGEITQRHGDAVEWYREGIAVDIMCHSDEKGWYRILSWEF